MRVYIKAKDLGEAIRSKLEKGQRTQMLAAKELKVTQGQISHVLAGHFKTKNSLVVKICKYVNIDPNEFQVPSQVEKHIEREALVALSRACGRTKQKTNVVIRVLRVLENLDIRA